MGREKTLFKKIAKRLTSTSLILALDGPLIVIFGYLLYGVPVNPEIIVASFLAVFSVYNLNKATDKAEDAINRPETATKPASHYIFPSIAAMLLSFAIGASVSPFALIVLVTPVIVGLFYSVKFSRKLPRLKEILGAKSLLVAFSWSFSGTFLPLSTQSADAGKIGLVFTYIFIQVIVNTILFDFLDMKGDSFSGMKTIPLVLGRNRTKNLLIVANSLLGLWLALCGFEGYFMKYLPALGFGVFYGYVIIWHFLRGGDHRLTAELMVDGQWLPLVAFMRLAV